MKMSEKCPTCGNEKTEPMHGGKGGSSFLKCKDCSRLFRGAGNKPSMKKSSDFTPGCEGMGCQACGGDRVEHLGTLGSRDHFMCKGCGMSFSSPREENAQAQSFNDSDLEPITKSVYQAKCTHCGKEQEKQGFGRALEALTCSSCGKNGGLKAADGGLPGDAKGIYGNAKVFHTTKFGVFDKSSLEKKGMSPGAVKAMALKKSVADIRKSAGMTTSDKAQHKQKYGGGQGIVPPQTGFLKKIFGKKKVEKKEIPQVEPATDETDLPGTKTIKNVKPKLIETDGSGSPTTGPDLQKKGMSPGAVKAMAMKKEGMDPGCTAGGDLQKAGIQLQKPPVGSSVSNHKVLPASTLPRTSQIPQVDRTAFLKGLIAKYGSKPSSKVSGIQASPQAQLTMPKPNMVAKSELAKVAPPGEEKLVHKLKDEYGHDEAGKKKAFATAWAIKNKTVKKAEMAGVPKAPSANTVKAPTAAKVAAPGVKQSNPTAPKTTGIKAPTTPKV